MIGDGNGRKRSTSPKRGIHRTRQMDGASILRLRKSSIIYRKGNNSSYIDPTNPFILAGNKRMERLHGKLEKFQSFPGKRSSRRFLCISLYKSSKFEWVKDEKLGISISTCIGLST
ncbi:hypothetical protein ACI2OX_11010 [Bacillus sp. N9]